MTFCNQCGKPVDEGSRFCSGCGALQKAADSSAPPEASYSPQETYYPQDYTAPDAPYTPQHTDYTAPDAPYTPQHTDYTAPDAPYTPQHTDYTAPDAPYTPQHTDYTAPQGYSPPPQPGHGGYPTPDSGSYYREDMPPAKKKPNKFLMIGVPVIAVAVIAAAVLALIFLRTTPLLAAARALNNFGTEVTERINTTPFRAIPMLVDAMKDGTVSVDIDNRDWLGNSQKANVTLSTNNEERDYYLKVDYTTDGESFDIEAFMDKDRIALGSGMLDGSYYGFRYSTFRSDIRKFGELVGLDDELMDSMSDVIEAIGEMMNEEQASEKYIKDYTDLMTKFMNNCEVKSERDTVESGGSSVRCTRVDFVVTEDALFALLDDYIDLMENNETIDKYLDMFGNELGVDIKYEYNNALRELEKQLWDFKREYTGDITISLFVGNRNRLLRMEFNVDIKYSGERTRVRGTFDFGASAQDRWLFNVTVTGDNYKESVRIVWDYRERTNAIENTLTITPPDSSDTVTLRSSWMPDRGNFTLSYSDKWDDSEISGVFKPDDDGFRLTFDNLNESSYYDEFLKIDIKVKNGAQIKKIDFINIDRWDESFLEKFAGLAGDIDMPGFGYDVPGLPGYTSGQSLNGYGDEVRVSQYTEFEFTPGFAGWWEIYTWDNGYSDPYVEVYDQWGTRVGYDDDSGGDYNAYLEVYLDAGVSYTIMVGFYGEDPNSCMLSVLYYG